MLRTLNFICLNKENKNKYTINSFKIEGFILQNRNCNNSRLKKESSSCSIRCPLPHKRVASVRSGPTGKTSLNALSRIQEREHSHSEGSRDHPRVVNNAEMQQVRYKPNCKDV